MQKEFYSKKINEGKIIPFTLVKYFTLTSFLLMFVGTIALSTFHTHLVRNIILKKSNDYAKVLVENLNHQIFLQFILPAVLKHGTVQLNKEAQFQRMDQVVKATLHSFEISMVNVYDLNNIVAYSFNPEIIGEKDIGGEGFKRALKGEMISKMDQSGSFLQRLIRYPETARISTFAPLMAEETDGTFAELMLGVIEIVQDVSIDYKKIFKLQILVILTTTMVMSALFLILRQIVKNGEDIIVEKNQERFRLKEELARARHLSSIGEMTAIISHEIKNPLGIIRSSAEHLSNKLKSFQEPSNFADIIIEEANRMNQIINDFLSFSRPRPLNLKAANINRVLEKNLEYLKYELSNNNCIVIRDFESNLPDIQMDEPLIYQTFLNILINAMQAMNHGGNIFIETKLKETSVSVEITDTGPGIPEDIIYKVKDPFFTTKTEGSGLGLGIVEQTIKKHNGQVNIDNTPENGAKISITLPLSSGDSNE